MKKIIATIICCLMMCPTANAGWHGSSHHREPQHQSHFYHQHGSRPHHNQHRVDRNDGIATLVAATIIGVTGIVFAVTGER